MKKIIVLTSVLFLCFPVAVFAGAWVQPEGGSYAGLSLSRYWSNKSYDDDGKSRNFGVGYNDSALNLYVEYGLGAEIDLIVSTAVKQAEQETPAEVGETSGITDFRLGMRYAFLNDNPALSLRAMLKIPSGYDAHHMPPLGQGQVDIDAALLYGYGFGWHYMSAGLGYRYRFEGTGSIEPADEVFAEAEWGVLPSDFVLLKLMGNATRSIESTTTRSKPAPGDLGVNLFNSNVREEVQIGAGGLLYLQESAGLSADLLKTVDGRNAGDGLYVSFGVFYNHKPEPAK